MLNEVLTIDEAIDLFISVVYHPDNLVYFMDYLRKRFSDSEVDEIFHDPKRFNYLLANDFEREISVSPNPQAACYVSARRHDSISNFLMDLENIQLNVGKTVYPCKKIMEDKGLFTAVDQDGKKVTQFTEIDVLDFQDDVIWLKSDKLSRMTIETLIDDEGNREKFTVMTKAEVMLDDERNDDMNFWYSLDDFLEWGHAYSFQIVNTKSFKSVYMHCILLDTLELRQEAEVSNKASVMVERSSPKFYDALEEFLQWGETYRIEFTEL